MAFTRKPEHDSPTPARSILSSPENMLGKKFDPSRRYILTTPLGVVRRRTEGYEVDLEGVEGAAGEKFILMSRKGE